MRRQCGLGVQDAASAVRRCVTHLAHFCFVPSISPVTITMAREFSCQIILQNASSVVSFGPCAAMYLIVPAAVVAPAAIDSEGGDVPWSAGDVTATQSDTSGETLGTVPTGWSGGAHDAAGRRHAAGRRQHPVPTTGRRGEAAHVHMHVRRCSTARAPNGGRTPWGCCRRQR